MLNPVNVHESDAIPIPRLSMPDERFDELVNACRSLRPEQLADRWIEESVNARPASPDAADALYATALSLMLALSADEERLLDLISLARIPRLSSEQGQTLLREVLRRVPTASSRRVAKALEMSPETVSTARRELEDSGAIPKESSRFGADGSLRPARRRS